MLISFGKGDRKGAWGGGGGIMLKGLHTVEFILCTFNLIRNSSTNLFDHHMVKQNKNTITGMLTVQTMHLIGLMLSTDQLHLSLSLSVNTHVHIREKSLLSFQWHYQPSQHFQFAGCLAVGRWGGQTAYLNCQTVSDHILYLGGNTFLSNNFTDCPVTE